MHLICVGISHHTAPLALREKLAMNRPQVDAALADLRDRYPDAELAILSTCNRTEVYAARPLHGHPRIEQVVQWLAHRHGVEPAELAPCLYHHDNERAIRHLFRVASGLDSMVVGESQIVQQVKQAYDAAQAAETAGRAVHRIFQAALSTSKRVRTQTSIGEGRLSVAGAAVEFARHLFDSLADKTVLAIGAGKMAELTVRHFQSLCPGRLIVVNRSAERAGELARRLDAEPIGLDRLDEALAAADVVISSTGSAEPILTRDRFKPLLKRRRFRPMFLIDIALPRDIEPSVGELANVYLYDLDDLQRAVAANQSDRHGAVAECEAMVEQAVGECYALVQTGDVSELIRRLRRQLHHLGEAESERTLHKLLDADPADFDRIVREHSQRLVNKILHKPLMELGRGGSQTAALYASALRRLFDLGDTEDLNPPERTGPASQRRSLPEES